MAKNYQKHKYAVYRRDNFTCRACGLYDEYGMALTLDHIKPRSKGGADTQDNLQCLCQVCNSMKSNHKTPDLVIRQKPDTSRSYEDIQQEILENRKAFYSSFRSGHSGWFKSQEKTMALIEKAMAKEKIKSDIWNQLMEAVALTFNKQKKYLQFMERIEEYRELVRVATPATQTCVFAYKI